MKKDILQRKNIARNILTSLTIIAITIGLAIPAFSQPFLYGPENPPPKESSITTSHTQGLGQIGRNGGMVFTIQNITLSNSTTVYWSTLDNHVRLSMDGSVFAGAEYMTVDPAQTNLAGGIVTWTGNTTLILAVGSQALYSKFIMTVTDLSNGPVPLVDPSITGLPAGSGGAVLVTSNTMVFKVRAEMLVSETGTAGTWVPHLDYYDPAATPPGAESAYSEYDFGFYWENDSPVLNTNEIIDVDEGDTVLIGNTELLAEDVESTSGEIKFIVDPLNTGLLPENGKLQYNGIDMTLPDTITMEDIFNDHVRYIHDDSETVKDSIALLVYDSDGAKYMMGEDSVFYVVFNITPLDDSPVVVNNTGVTIDEGDTIVITEDMLLTTDAESSAGLVKYTLDPDGATTYPSTGLMTLNDIPLGDGSTFTQEDLANGMLKYVQDGSEETSDGFLFRVEDEFGHFALNGVDTDFFFQITVTLTNDNPHFNKNLQVVVEEGDTVVISNSYIAAIDEESGPEDIMFTIDPDFSIPDPWFGKVFLDDVELAHGESFSMDDVNNNLVSYAHDGGESTNDMIPIGISDPHGGIARDGIYTVFQIRITVTPVNDPPTLDNPIDDQEAMATQAYSFTFAENTFGDVDVGDEFTYSALQDDDSALPDWLDFDGPTRTFSGTPLLANEGEIVTIAVKATDKGLAEIKDAFILEVKTFVGIQSHNEADRVSVYPNPFTDQIHLSFSESYNKEIAVKIINLLGEEIFESIEKTGSMKIIDLSDQPPGIYFIRVEDGKDIVSLKVMKQ